MKPESPGPELPRKVANISAAKEGLNIYGFDRKTGKGWLLNLTWDEVADLARERGEEFDPSDFGRLVHRGVRRLLEE